ncbi:MAG TPA: exonuclease domain-containing protein [Verrucomicrobiae bacterium]|nr:exonuclease domain-containing protein [Verrucomicrobiae bacterium]
MFKEPVVFVDIETSGGSYTNSRIIEIAVIRVENGEITETFHSLVNPGTNLPYFITKLTGITDADLVSAPYFPKIAPELARILKDALFVAHNVTFDYSFIANEMQTAGLGFAPPRLCTVRLSRALYPQHKSHSLENILSRHNISVAARHRAYDDALALWEFSKIALTDHGEIAFKAAVNHQLKRPNLPPHLNEALVHSLPNTSGVYIFEDEARRPLYVGKSVTIRTRVLSHFAQSASVAKERKLATQTHHIRHIETADELSALLLESKLIKELLPVYNRLLRRKRTQVVVKRNLTPEGYATISISQEALENTDITAVYGTYDSRLAARRALVERQKQFQLCSKLLGLENTKGACFHHHLGWCKGACVGKEPIESYNQRLDQALHDTRIERWPYEGPVLLRHRDQPDTALTIDQWRVIEEANNALLGSAAFDIDTYRILRSYIMHRSHLLEIEPLKPAIIATK